MDAPEFLFLTENNSIIPGLAVLTTDGNDFVNEAYVIIEDDDYASRIIDVQNWDKQRLRYVHYEYAALREYDIGGRFYYINTCQLYHVDAAGQNNICDHYQGVEKVNINGLNGVDQLTVTGAFGRLYIFIHRLRKQRVDVYLREAGSLEAKHLDKAIVRFQELTPDNQLLKLRSEYGRMPESYSTASRDVKQSIIRAALRNTSDQAAIKGAISLCQTERGTANVCQTLPIEDKTRMCFSGGNLNNARLCERVPVVTQTDFERWIPRQLDIDETDELQLTHDFYKQSYKMHDEGYAEAMHKARIINTICALSRPDILTSYADILPTLPAYLDIDLINRVLQSYRSINARLIDKVIGENYGKYKAPYGIRVVIPGAYLETKVTFEFIFNSVEEDLSNPEVTDFECRIDSRPQKAEDLMAVELMLDAIGTSQYLNDQPLLIEGSALRSYPEDAGSAYLYITDDKSVPDVVASYAFLVSKILRTLFDYGFLEKKAEGLAFTIEAGPVLNNIYNTAYIIDLL